MLRGKHIGIDAEWRPHSQEFRPVALVQIATDSAVFLVDMLALYASSVREPLVDVASGETFAMTIDRWCKSWFCEFVFVSFFLAAAVSLSVPMRFQRFVIPLETCCGTKVF